MNFEAAQLPTQDDIDLYFRIMGRVGRRLGEAARQLRVEPLHSDVELLYAALQLRVALEEVALSSLVTNRLALEEARRSVNNAGWDGARKAVRAVNPRYWPFGTFQDGVVDGLPKMEAQPDAIQEPEVGRIWGHLSALLHASNPMDSSRDAIEDVRMLVSLVRRLRLTLDTHMLYFAGDAMAIVSPWEHGIIAGPFRRASEEESRKIRGDRTQEAGADEGGRGSPSEPLRSALD